MENKVPDYLIRDRYGDLDVRPLAALLAKELGGTIIIRNKDGETFSYFADIQVGNDRVSINRHRGQGLRIRVTVGAVDIAPDILSEFTVVGGPEPTFDATRPIPVLAKAIRARAIDAAQDALTRNRAKAANVIAARDKIRAIADQVRADFPNLRVAVRNGGGDVDGSFKDTYFNARISTEGINFDRIGGIPYEKARRIIAILAED